MSRRHLGAIDRDRKCLRGRSDSVMLARNCETKASRTHEEDDDQNEADKSTTPRQGGRVKQRRHAVKAAHLAPLKELLDQLWDDERTDRQQHHHRRADDGEADEVTREVRHAVEGDRGVARLHDHAAAGSAHDRVSGSEGKLHGPNRGLVASDPSLGDGASRDLGCRGGLGANRGARYAYRLPVLGAPPFLAALLAHRESSLSETESPHPAALASRAEPTSPRVGRASVKGQNRQAVGGAVSGAWGATLGGLPPACCWAVGLNRQRRGLRHVVSQAQLYP